jgi:hypothetical protein
LLDTVVKPEEGRQEGPKHRKKRHRKGRPKRQNTSEEKRDQRKERPLEIIGKFKPPIEKSGL